jgi:hypothetical protein
LRALEAKLRTRYEEPARAAAKELGLSRVPKDEAELLKAIASHERSYRQAVLALDRLARSSTASVRGGRRGTRTDPPLEPPASLVAARRLEASGPGCPDGAHAPQRHAATALRTVVGTFETASGAGIGSRGECDSALIVPPIVSGGCVPDPRAP